VYLIVWTIDYYTTVSGDCCSTPSEPFQSYTMEGASYIKWDDDNGWYDVRFVLDQVSWSFIVLAHWNNTLRIDMSPHIILILSQSVFTYSLVLRS